FFRRAPNIERGRRKDAAASARTDSNQSGTHSWKVPEMHSSVFSSLAAASIAFTLTACEFQSTSGGSPDGGASTDAAGPAGLSEADMAPLGRMVLDDGAGADGLAKLTGNGPVLFRSDLEDQNSSCWGSRSSSGYARTACGEWGSIGSWNSKLTDGGVRDRKSTRLNSSHVKISYAVFCLKKKKPT